MPLPKPLQVSHSTAWIIKMKVPCSGVQSALFRCASSTGGGEVSEGTMLIMMLHSVKTKNRFANHDSSTLFQ